MKTKIFTCVFILFLVGCDEKIEVKNVDFYIENTDARKKMLDYCIKNNIDQKLDNNCYNAKEAESNLRRRNAKEIQFNLNL